MVDTAKAWRPSRQRSSSPRTPFDDFRDALAVRRPRPRLAPVGPAQRGCKNSSSATPTARLCHLGPRFTSGEFGDIGIPFFVRRVRWIPGRPGRPRGGCAASPFNLLGNYNDDTPRATARGVHLRPRYSASTPTSASSAFPAPRQVGRGGPTCTMAASLTPLRTS